MKNIIYVGNFELPDKNAAAHRVLNNSKILKELGFNVIMIDTKRGCKDSVVNTESSCFGFKYYSINHDNKRLVSIAYIRDVIQNLQKKVDYIIAYNFPSIALYRLLKFCKNNSIKLISDCTEWFGFVGFNPIKKVITGIDSFIRMEIVQPRLDGIIAISRLIEDHYKGKVNTICIPPLCDLNEVKWKAEVSDRSDKIEILYAGNPGKHKDKLNIIIENIYIHNLNNIIFRIIGITKEQYLKYYPKHKVILDNLSDVVIFMGRLPHETVIRYLKKADYSMFYRNVTRVTMAGFPTKFSESITCGTPVITNKTSDLEEYLIAGENGFWIDDIGNDLAEIINSKDLIKYSQVVNRRMFDYHGYISSFSKMFF